MRESRELAVGECEAAARESVWRRTLPRAHALARHARAAFKAASTAAKQPLSSEVCPCTSDSTDQEQQQLLGLAGVGAARSRLRIHLRLPAAHGPIRPTGGCQRLLPGVAAGLVEAWAFFGLLRCRGSPSRGSQVSRQS